MMRAAGGAAPRALVSGEAAETVVLLHGLGGGADSWAPVVEALAPRYRVLAWDMPGYGESPPLKEMSFPALAGALLALMDAHGVDAAHLVGHSMGGMVAQEFAATHPERVRALVLSATSPAFGRPGGDWQKAFLRERLAALDAGQSLVDLAPAMVAALVGDDPDPEGVELAVACLARVPEATYRAAMRCLVTFDRRDALGRIAVPTLLLAGEKDTTAPPAMMERMAGHIPGARYQCIPGAGHLANLERPTAFSTAVLEFLQQAEAA